MVPVSSCVVCNFPTNFHAAYLFYHKIAQKFVSNFHLAAFCIALYFLHTKGLLSADEKCSTALQRLNGVLFFNGGDFIILFRLSAGSHKTFLNYSHLHHLPSICNPRLNASPFDFNYRSIKCIANASQCFLNALLNRVPQFRCENQILVLYRNMIQVTVTPALSKFQTSEYKFII